MIRALMPCLSGLPMTLAAGAERRSEHPLGRAIVTCAEARRLAPAEPTAFRMTAGRGIAAVIAGRTILLGNEAALREQNIPLSDAASAALARVQREGKASVLVAEGDRCLGLIALADTLRRRQAPWCPAWPPWASGPS